jgi:hypothetical protein
MHPFFNKKQEAIIKWKLNIPTVLIGHAREAQPIRAKIAGFDLVIGARIDTSCVANTVS